MNTAVEFRNISKQCGAVHACKNISFKVAPGTIHALVGENGAGKTTLMNILGGILLADSGTMLVHEKPYRPASAKDAFKSKIGFIHQHFLLAENLTVMDHLLLNWPEQKLLTALSRTDLLKKVSYFTSKFNWTLNFNQKISQLSIGEQQRIEIIKALLTEPDILIFDEPTAVLAPQEILDFLNFLMALKNEGRTLILISHKLHEVKKVADHITVLRHGESVLSKPAAEMTLVDIAESMIGKKLNYATAATVRKISTSNAIHFPDLNLQLNFSEITGFAGIEGHGQSLLIEKFLTSIKAKKITFADIPEDRIKFAIIPSMTLVDHMVLRHPEFSSKGFIQTLAASAATKKIILDWDVRPPEPDHVAEKLSGGNQQKFVIGRELFSDPDFILAAHPTRGVDLGAQQLIHSAFIRARDNGKSIVLISADLEEILLLSDQLIVLYKHELFGPFQKAQLSETEIGQFMTGTHPNQQQHRIGKIA